ncbi:MAG: hypothetical protein PVG49_21595, partial [Desulfobacteraceae bacterium]
GLSSAHKTCSTAAGRFTPGLRLQGPIAWAHAFQENVKNRSFLNLSLFPLHRRDEERASEAFSRPLSERF